MGHPVDATNTERGTQTVRCGTGRHLYRWCQRHVVLLVSCLAATVVVLLTVVIALTAGYRSVSHTTGEPLSNYTEAPTQIPGDPELTLPDGRSIVPRSEWSSVPPDFVRPLHHPTPFVVISHTAGRTCRGAAQCFPLLRAYRSEHSLKWDQPDISYNFLIDVEGGVYEGRGWDATNNLRSWPMRCNLLVGLMGNFMVDWVTPGMLQALQHLLELGVALGKLDPDYRLVAHNQVFATLSPGVNVLDAISTWPQRCLHDCDEGVQCVYEGVH